MSLRFLGVLAVVLAAACSAPEEDVASSSVDAIRAGETWRVRLGLGGSHTCAITRKALRCWGRNTSGQTDVPALRNPRRVAAGTSHTCAIDDDGLKCWGNNVAGQATVPLLTHPTDVGAGTSHTCSLSDEGVTCWGSNAQQQTNVPALVQPTAVSVGGSHSCAITSEGVKCWGKNVSGQTNAPLLREPTAISLGSNHSCALHADGVKCWGNNAQGQTDVPTLRNPTQVTAGSSHTCARDDDGVKCWGSNGSMQTTVPDLRRPTQISAGSSHTCAVDDDADVRCWGDNANLQATVPSDLDLGGHHTCVIARGELRCTGDNERGQLGVGTNHDQIVALTSASRTNLGQAFEPVQVALGSSFGCALSRAGAVKCWGANGYGQLGVGDNLDRGTVPEDMGEALPALRFATKEPIHKIDVGEDHACALSNAGEVFCWGKGSSGQLGMEATENAPNPTRIRLKPGVVVQDLVLGRRHTCVLGTDGGVYCFGGNEAGQLGVGHTNGVGHRPGTMGDAMQAVMLGKSFHVKTIASGDDHVCALSDQGQVKCWGRGNDGQLALGDASDRGASVDGMGDALPTVDLGHGQVISELECGARHCCARTIQNTMKCWGDNAQGQLGLGDVLPRGKDAQSTGDGLPFVMTPPAEAVLTLQLDGSHTCARTTSGVRCWGSNHSGELGYGDQQPRGGTLTTVPRLLAPRGI